MTEKPLWVQQFNRPVGTEIKHIGNRWYLYERLSVYDPKFKRKRKKSGRILGAITEEGFKPSRSRSSLFPVGEVENREYGATALLLSLTGSMRTRLQSLFPDCWRELYAMALLKCKEQSSFGRMDFHYQTSFLEQVLGPVTLSPERITDLLQYLGTDREAIREYMKADIPGDRVIIFDGHRLIGGSENLEYAYVDYDSRRRFLHHVNLLYMFSIADGRRMPVFYKQYSGSVPYVTAFSDIVMDSGTEKEEATIIADKGFESDLNEELLDDEKLGYVLAVRRGCADIAEIPNSPTKYQKVFKFRECAICCNEYHGEGENTFLYYDMSLANDEALDFIGRRERANGMMARRRALEDRRRAQGRGRLTQEEYDRLQPVDVAKALHEHRANGTFILKTNRREVNCAQAYYLYKIRQDIEQAFKFNDDTLDGTASYMRSQYSFEAWLFINHLALQMLYAVTQVISDRGLTAKYSFTDAMQFLKHVRVNRINGEWHMTKITKHTLKLCKDLSIEMETPAALIASLK